MDNTKLKEGLAGARKSLTMWFNGLVGTALIALPVVQDALPQLQPYLGPDLFRQLSGVLVIGNILLRIRTSKPLSEK